MNDYLKKQAEDAKKYPWHWIGLIVVVGLIVWLASCSNPKDDEGVRKAAVAPPGHIYDEVERTVTPDERRAQ